MKLADLLTPGRMIIPTSHRDFSHALAALLSRLEESGAVEGPRDGEDPLFDQILRGSESEIVALGNGIVVVAVQTPRVEELVLGLAVGSVPFEGIQSLEAISGAETVVSPQVMLLLMTPRGLKGLRQQAFPALKRTMRERERRDRLRSVQSVSQLRAFSEFMDLELFETLQVSDASDPLVYRVYPDTPMSEVLDLMARRGVTALPVVGEKHEVLGMITAGEALRYLLPRRRAGRGEASGEQNPDSGTSEEEVKARDVMSRSVMCVAEDQDLLDAANLMVNRDVAQLPVIREGEIVGFLSRDAALRRLLGRGRDK
ncbi:MAG: CBS domain-containing protein [Gemmatimonadota bacterium]